MSKIISVKSELWNGIYYPIRNHFLSQADPDVMDKKSYLEKCFADIGIILHKDGLDESWSHIEITDDVDIVELCLRWL